MQTKFQTVPMAALLLVVLAGCGGTKHKGGGSSQGASDDNGGGTSDDGLVHVPVTMNQGAFALVDSATAATIDLEGCASGNDPVAVVVDPSAADTIPVIRLDRNCVAELVEFDFNGVTYDRIETAFANGQAVGDFAIFHHDTNTDTVVDPGEETVKVTVLRQLGSPVLDSDHVEFVITDYTVATDETIAAGAFHHDAVVALSGTESPTFSVHSVSIKNITAAGIASLEFVLECDVAVTEVNGAIAGKETCDTHEMTDISYVLIEDPNTGADTTEAEAIAAFAAASGGDLVPAPHFVADGATMNGSAVTNGGFKTYWLDTPDTFYSAATTPRPWVLILQDSGSYTAIDVTFTP